MNNNKNIKLIIITIVFICTIFSRIDMITKALNQVSSEALAVTLVIDTSGSMATTDPEKLREIAANIFIDLLSPEDYLSIITFNTKKEVVLPMQKIQSNDNKANIKKILSQKLQAIGDTDYLLALNEASKQLSSVKEGNLRKVILFLTDGEPDPNGTKESNPESMEPYMDLLWETVSNLAINKYPVYSVGFSKGVDLAILQRISSSTGGTVKIYDDSSKLALNFSEISGEVKNTEEFLNKTFELEDSKNLEITPEPIVSQPSGKLLVKPWEYLLNYLKANILMLVCIFAGLSLLIILLGLLLYILLVYRNTMIKGKLIYWKQSDLQASIKKQFNFNKINRPKVIISLNSKNKNSQYNIFHSEYDYNIELINIPHKSKWKFIDGFKALFYRNNSSELLLKTTEPGIFIYDNSVFTSKKIYKNDKFITGGYIFKYIVNDKTKSIDKGKNLLEEYRQL